MIIHYSRIKNALDDCSHSKKKLIVMNLLKRDKKYIKVDGDEYYIDSTTLDAGIVNLICGWINNNEMGFASQTP